MAPRQRTPCCCPRSNHRQTHRLERYPSWPQRPARPTTKRTTCAVSAQFSFWLPCRLAACEKWIERKALRPDSRPSREILRAAAWLRPKQYAASSQEDGGQAPFLLGHAQEIKRLQKFQLPKSKRRSVGFQAPAEGAGMVTWLKQAQPLAPGPVDLIRLE